MDQIAAQTEKISSYETSRTRRSIVDGNMHSDDSNNDDEFATSGFYVREKTSDKKPDSTDKPVEESVSDPLIDSPDNTVVANDSDPKDSEDEADAAEADVSDSKDSEDEAVEANVSDPKDSEDDAAEEVNDPKGSTDNNIASVDVGVVEGSEDDVVEASADDSKGSEDDIVEASASDSKGSEDDVVKASVNDLKGSEDEVIEPSVNDPKGSEDDPVETSDTDPKGSADDAVKANANVSDSKGSEGDAVEASVSDPIGSEDDVVEASVSDPLGSADDVVEASASIDDPKGSEDDVDKTRVEEPKASEDNFIETIFADDSMSKSHLIPDSEDDDDDVVITSVSGPKGTKGVGRAIVRNSKDRRDDVVEIDLNDSKGSDDDDVVEVRMNDSKGSEDDVIEVRDNDPKASTDNGIEEDATESKDSTDKVSATDLRDSAECEVKENANDSKDSSNNVTESSATELKENGISTEEDPSTPLLNGENSKDDESSKVDPNNDKGDQEDDKESNMDLGSDEISHADENSKVSENKEDSKVAAEEKTCDNEADKEATEKGDQSTLEKTDDNVTSSTNNETEDGVTSSSKNDEENDVSSTSNTADESKMVEEPKGNDKNEKPKEGEDGKEETAASKQTEKADSADSSKNKEDDTKQPEISAAKPSILKEHLEKSTTESEENADQDVEMDEDFDPSLLCPDISMDVDEASVMTTSDRQADDGSTSPLPYEPIFSTLVDEITGAEVQIDLTPAEMEMRRKMYGPDNPVQATKVHCTACNVHLGSAMTGANNRFVHPLLKVLICKNCYHFYTSGEFEKDEDGSELYCRWCGQGGQVLCCSSCEFVFCKRCIRNNFGPKKFKEIRDSDDWNCFRCHPEQLSNLRASCAEFMEYYRTELARAQSLSDTKPELMTTDYTKCCSTPPEKKDEPKAPVTKTRRKRKEEEDPDYKEEPPIKKLAPSAGTPGYNSVPQSTMRPIVPKSSTAPVRPVGTTPLRPQGTVTTTTSGQGQIFKVGNTTFRTKAPGTTGYTVQRPMMNQAPRNNTPGYITIPQSKTTSPGYIKILPQRMNAPTQSPYTVVSSTSNNSKPNFNAIRPSKPAQMPAMKHEWFEKTVRAAARVNSNLSYTLTQLNRQQSQANSVEGLAMVHNRLQEVLSTSINSLIQIRKNLRTEFIAGIKNTKFVPKQPAASTPAVATPSAAPIVVKDDDDVIFVNPATTVSQTRPPPLTLSPSITITKKTPAPKSSDVFSNPKPSTSGLTLNSTSKPAVTTTTTPSIGPIKGGGFLKVRSLTALQTVPSECITIPDDPPVVHVIEEDPLKIDHEESPKPSEPTPITVDAAGKKKPQNKAENGEVSSTSSAVDEFMVYDVMKKPTPQVKKMMSAFVALTKSARVDELLQAQGLLNGNSEKRESISSSKPQRSRATKC